MGCGASSEAGLGVANPTAAPAASKPATDGFMTDLLEFLFKAVTDEDFIENLFQNLGSSDNPSTEVEKLLKAVISIIETVASTTPPKHKMSEFLLGCLVAFLCHLTVKFKGPEKTLQLATLQEAGYHLDAKWADAVYDKDKCADPRVALAESLSKQPFAITIKPEDIVHFRPTSSLAKPAVALALDHSRQLILVVVRGTANFKDMLTDAAGAAREWCGGYAHEMVSTGAKAIFEELRSQILDLKKANPAYAVRTVGHSLGGGTAGCLALLMHRDEEFAKAVYGDVTIPAKKAKGRYMITSVGFGSAAVLSRDLTEEVHPYVTTVVHDSDLVPRLCLQNISDLVVTADVLVDVFKAVAKALGSLIAGETPEGMNDFEAIGMLAKAATDPAGLLREMLQEQAEAGIQDAVAATLSRQDPKRLYAPGRLVLLTRPESSSAAASRAYSIAKGSMATEASELLLRGSMLRDHSMEVYVHVCCTGEVHPGELTKVAAAS
ncbi:hypothetical protein Agub_g9385 [Astrephomene gubernaculifera]|uniref:Fungal lipase-type domain-containing protein n=1 Tax=Astrephomene gubernaculifera TaxID=47775 RepID=A0AAD3HNY1_9CHLO|nr:hypothetical protein Agub_g9385 [Astrephomene gubernaculifera]